MPRTAKQKHIVGRTPWHPTFVELLRLALPQGDWHVQPEAPLAREPLRVDVIVIRRHEHARLPRLLRRPLSLLSAYNLVHFISPTDEPCADDALALLAYACQFIRLQGKEGPSMQKHTRLFVVCSKLTPRYLAALARLAGSLDALEAGLHRGHLGGFELHVIETLERSKHKGERLWATMSTQLLDLSLDLTRASEEELEVCRRLHRLVQDLQEVGDPLMAAQLQKMSKGYKAVLRRILDDMPVEDRLAGLAPEERVAGLAPEERVAGLAPEERVAGLAPEERVAGLAPEQLGEALGDHAVLALPDELLRALAPDAVATLPEDVQARIATRLAKKPARSSAKARSKHRR